MTILTVIILGIVIGLYGHFTGASYEEMSILMLFTMNIIILSRLYKLENLIENNEIKVEVYDNESS